MTETGSDYSDVTQVELSARAWAAQSKPGDCAILHLEDCDLKIMHLGDTALVMDAEGQGRRIAPAWIVSLKSGTDADCDVMRTLAVRARNHAALLAMVERVQAERDGYRAVVKAARRWERTASLRAGATADDDSWHLAQAVRTLLDVESKWAREDKEGT